MSEKNRVTIAENDRKTRDLLGLRGKYGPGGEDAHGRVGLEHPRVSPDVARELMFHHLQLAAMYFEATPDDDLPTALKEMVRSLTDPDLRGHEPPGLAAARAWVVEITRVYDDMKKDDVG